MNDREKIAKLRARVLYYFVESTDKPSVSLKGLKRLLETDSLAEVYDAIEALPEPASVDLSPLEGLARLRDKVALHARESSRADEVFKYWLIATGRKTAKKTPNREKKIKARLKEGYTVEELKKAVDGMMADPFFTGKNENGKKYTEIHNCMGSGEKVERFIDNKAVNRLSPYERAMKKKG